MAEPHPLFDLSGKVALIRAGSAARWRSPLPVPVRT